MYVGWRAADARNSGAVDTGRAPKGEVRRAAAASAYEEEVAILRSGPDAEFPLSQEIIDAGLQQTYAALRASFYKLTIGVRRVAVIAPSAPVPPSLPSIQELLADPQNPGGVDLAPLGPQYTQSGPTLIADSESRASELGSSDRAEDKKPIRDSQINK